MVPSELKNAKKIITPTKGLPDDNNHDPSNVIKHEGEYYFWYTQHIAGKPYDHFKNCKIMYKTSQDGINWGEGRDALLPSKRGWDDSGVLTAYVAPCEGKFYMFYMGVGSHFHIVLNNKRGCGVAVSDSPKGPWKRCGDREIIYPDRFSWDNVSCDDVTVIYKDGKWMMYYKGRTRFRKFGSSEGTRVGLAFSDSITGPYTKYRGNPLMRGHAFAIWPYKHGFLYLSGLKDTDEGSVYENWHDSSGSQSLYWSQDGLSFEKCCEFANRSAGLYTSVVHDGSQEEVTEFWGLMVGAKTGHMDRYIERFDIVLGGK